jgi:riboflavin kinase/FMN adenylyltransferase
VVTIGSFDGVHIGHQALVKRLVTEAHARQISAIVITFYPHPAVVLRNIEHAYYLTTPDERAALLQGFGVDHVITLPFTRELAALSAEEFMRLLHGHLHLKTLIVGSDFALGRNRQGDVPELRKLGQTLGYEVDVIEPVTQTSQVVSSSLIRQALLDGNVSSAASMLGRYYAVSGPVVHGDARGRKLGIPTANIEPPEERIVPASGVYATQVLMDGARLPSVTNIGSNPTFEPQAVSPRIETHILDLQRDLYGNQLSLEFVDFLRPEERFQSVDQLVDQIHLDIHQAREVLKHAA